MVWSKGKSKNTSWFFFILPNASKFSFASLNAIGQPPLISSLFCVHYWRLTSGHLGKIKEICLESRDNWGYDENLSDICRKGRGWAWDISKVIKLSNCVKPKETWKDKFDKSFTLFSHFLRDIVLSSSWKTWHLSRLSWLILDYLNMIHDNIHLRISSYHVIAWQIRLSKLCAQQQLCNIGMTTFPMLYKSSYVIDLFSVVMIPLVTMSS